MKSELRRQFIHFLFGSGFIALIALRGTLESLLVLAAVFAAGLVFSYAIKKGVKVPLVFQTVQRVERDYEKRLPGKGALLFFLGAIITILLFWQKELVIGALCVAVYGDAASTVVGLKFGRHRIAGKKTLEGSLGGMVAAFFFLSFIFAWQTALAASIVGMLAELLPFDDNFTIPVAAGAMLSILI